MCSLLRAHARIHLRLTRLIAHRWAERSRIVSVQWPAVRWLGWIVGERHDIAAVVLEVGLICSREEDTRGKRELGAVRVTENKRRDDIYVERKEYIN